jgi:hypothetical protein
MKSILEKNYVVILNMKIILSDLYFELFDNKK